MNLQWTLCFGMLLCVEQVNCLIGGVAMYQLNPFYVRLESKIMVNEVNLTLYCGGVIISESWVLTLATCVSIDSTVAIKYMSEAKNHLLISKVLYSKEKYFFVHYQRLAPRSVINDLALIRTEIPFEISDSYPKIAFLPSSCMKGSNEYKIVGILTKKYREPTNIHELSVYPSNPTSCWRTLPVADQKGRTPEMMAKYGFCAGGVGKGPCELDAGGPVIVYRTGPNNWSGQTLVGIIPSTANLSHCDPLTDYNMFYVSIEPYMDWIEDTMRRSHKLLSK